MLLIGRGRLADALRGLRVKLFGEARPDLGECLHVGARVFEGAAAVHVGGPVGGVDERFLRILAEDLGHEGDEVLRDARVFEERLYDRVGETRLLVDLTEPVLRPIRTVLGAILPIPIDFSPIVAWLVIGFLQNLLRSAYRDLG